jgi:NAD(P) transhydrogenase subunit alpha
MTLIAVVTVFVLAVFVGLEVISKVPQTLHTPLMSATNAIHGVILVGGILVLASAESPAMVALGIAAVLFGTLNVVGGYVVTDRMLEMFKVRRKAGGK